MDLKLKRRPKKGSRTERKSFFKVLSNQMEVLEVNGYKLNKSDSRVPIIVYNKKI